MKKVYRMILMSAIVLSVVLIFTRYQTSFLRLLDSFRDLGTALIYYFKAIFLNDNTYVPTVNTIPDVDLGAVLGIDIPEIVRKLEAFPDAFFQKEIFQAYNVAVLLKLTSLMQLLTVAMPVILVLYLILDSALMAGNNRHGKKTKPLQVFLKIFTKPYRATKKFLKSFISFAKGSRYVRVLLWIWAINLNVVTMFVGFFAFYFYFVAAVTFAELPTQLVKLFIDVLIMFSGLPFLAWFFLFWKIFDKWRRDVGLDVLRHNEAKNRGFLNSLPVAIMLTGTMGSKKTTTVTDMVLSYNAHFRDKALEMLQKHEKRYINFPWINFEKHIEKAMRKRQIFNLASAREYVQDLRRKFYQKPDRKRIFGYNLVDNPIVHDDGLTVKDIWNTLEIYAQLYLIYIVEGSYSFSNYSIRFDTVKIDQGNFPIYDNDFFARPSTFEGDGSTFAHVVDFDLFRLGKTLMRNNVRSGAFEFGIVSLSEIGKERGNQNDTKELKKLTSDTNQKNDLFNDSIKLARHAATVDNYPFIHFLDDDQRADSTNADLRQLHDLLNIAETSDLRLAMPGFVFEDMIHDLVMPGLNRLHLKMRHARGDKTLLGFMLDQILAGFENHYARDYNLYGYYECQIEIENGKQDGNVDVHPYYLSTKKIYSNRFSTDCFSDYFADRSKRAGMSINDYITYRTTRATLDELRLQNSYLIGKLDHNFTKNDNQEDSDDDEYLEYISKFPSKN